MQTPVHTYTCSQSHTQTHAHTYTRVHTHAHVHTHTHTHTHMTAMQTGGEVNFVRLQAVLQRLLRDEQPAYQRRVVRGCHLLFYILYSVPLTMRCSIAVDYRKSVASSIQVQEGTENLPCFKPPAWRTYRMLNNRCRDWVDTHTHAQNGRKKKLVLNNRCREWVAMRRIAGRRSWMKSKRRRQMQAPVLWSRSAASRWVGAVTWYVVRGTWYVTWLRGTWYVVRNVVTWYVVRYVVTWYVVRYVVTWYVVRGTWYVTWLRDTWYVTWLRGTWYVVRLRGTLRGYVVRGT